MVNDTALYGLEMAMDIRFNQKLTKDDYVVPGGYEMVFGGRRISFDFLDYYGSIDNDDPTILHCEMKNPNFSAFEEFWNVSSEDLRNVCEIVECYVYIGEECDPELKEIEIVALTFWPADEDSVVLSDDIIMKYNTKLKG